jgi:hypothetical protein
MIWVVAPSYHDVPSFLRLAAELRRVLDATFAQKPDVRFLLVDDSAGADPETASLAASPDTTLLTPPFNLGHQGALVWALRSLATIVDDKDLVVTLDADGEDRPEDLPRLLAPLQELPGSPRRIVLARRTTRVVSAPFRVMYLVFSVMFWVLTGTLIRTGNYAAFRGWVLRRVLSHPNFDLAYSAALLSLNLEVQLVPCPRGRRYAGHSKMGYLKLIRHGFSMLMPFLDRIAVRTLLTFSGVIAIALPAVAVPMIVGLRTTTDAPQAWLVQVLGVLLLACLVAFGNFVVVFAVYAQAQGAALRGLAVEPLPSSLRVGSGQARADQPAGN